MKKLPFSNHVPPYFKKQAFVGHIFFNGFLLQGGINPPDKHHCPVIIAVLNWEDEMDFQGMIEITRICFIH